LGARTLKTDAYHLHLAPVTSQPPAHQHITFFTSWIPSCYPINNVKIQKAQLKSVSQIKLLY